MVLHLSFSLTIWMFLGWRVCRWKVSLMTARVFVGFQEQFLCMFTALSFACSVLNPSGPYEVLLRVCCFISGLRCSAFAWSFGSQHISDSFTWLCFCRTSHWMSSDQSEVGGVACPQQQWKLLPLQLLETSHGRLSPNIMVFSLFCVRNLFLSFWGTLMPFRSICTYTVSV